MRFVIRPSIMNKQTLLFVAVNGCYLYEYGNVLIEGDFGMRVFLMIVDVALLINIWYHAYYFSVSERYFHVHNAVLPFFNSRFPLSIIAKIYLKNKSEMNHKLVIIFHNNKRKIYSCSQIPLSRFGKLKIKLDEVSEVDAEL